MDTLQLLTTVIHFTKRLYTPCHTVMLLRNIANTTLAQLIKAVPLKSYSHQSAVSNMSRDDLISSQTKVFPLYPLPILHAGR